MSKNFSDYDNLTSLFTGIKNKNVDIEKNIAPVEADASSSSKAYAVNSRLILGDKLYKVIAAIDVGDELVVDTNIELSSDLVTLIGQGGGGATYTAGAGIDISEQNEISSEIVMFTGTHAQWDALSLQEKCVFTHASFTDDATPAVNGGSGSLIVVTTNEESLYGKTVSVTDGYLVWQGTFSESGLANITGVTGVGKLTITSTDGTDTARKVITAKCYSKYELVLDFYIMYGFKVDSTKATDNVSYEVQYDGKNVENYSYDSAYMNFNIDTWRWGSWTGEEFFMPRPVLISQDYQTKIYLNPDNLNLDVDGHDVSAMLTGTTDGYNAMMEWGKDGNQIWYKLVPDENDDATYTCYIADKQVDNGFVAWAFYDANDVLGEHFYTSIYNGSVVSNVLRSLSGKSPNNTTVGATQITYAKANNVGGESYAWYIDVFADRILINLLMMLVIKSTNSDVIGYGNYTGGSSASSLIQTGQGNYKGMFYGKQSNSVCKVFGMENYFGNCWRRMAGLNLNGGVELYKLTYGTADGSSAAGYIESDSAPSNYLTGKTIATNLSQSYITKESAKADGALLPSAFGGSNNNYYSDGCWSATGSRFARVGGGCGDGSLCGAFALTLSGALSSSAWSTGASLSLKPVVQTGP